jgi:hypothetical protein
LEHFSVKDLATTEVVRATFIKKATGLAKYTASRVAYAHSKRDIPNTVLKNTVIGPPIRTTHERGVSNRREIWNNFYGANVVTNQKFIKGHL